MITGIAIKDMDNWLTSTYIRFQEISTELSKKARRKPTIHLLDGGHLAMTWKEPLGLSMCAVAWNDSSRTDFLVVYNGMVLHKGVFSDSHPLTVERFMSGYQPSDWFRVSLQLDRIEGLYKRASADDNLKLSKKERDAIAFKETVKVVAWLRDLRKMEPASRANKMARYLVIENTKTATSPVYSSWSLVPPELDSRYAAALGRWLLPVLSIAALILIVSLIVEISNTVGDPVKDMIERTSASGSNRVLIQTSDERVRSFTVERYLTECIYGFEGFCENETRNIEVCIEKSYVLEFDRNYVVDGELKKCGFYSDHKRDGGLRDFGISHQLTEPSGVSFPVSVEYIHPGG